MLEPWIAQWQGELSAAFVVTGLFVAAEAIAQAGNTVPSAVAV
jgi:hypothetical protein